MQLRHVIIASLAVGVFSFGVMAASDAKHPIQKQWTFEGPAGYVDKQAAQRGFQVYKEVCSACHGVKLLAFRNMQELGFSEAEVKALASSYQVQDGPNEEGDMFERAGLPSDRFPSPYANEQQGRALNNGAYPPDLSLMIKARPDGANYVYSLLTGYTQAPDNVELLEGQYYNPYMAGGKIAMPAPLSDGQVTYMDGTEATIDQMSSDVVHFLQWAAEPEMQKRKSLGLKVMAFLVVMTIIFYLTKRRVWKDLH
jgi:ubiquinol-cytochrome c reductase cytochrome c1 subunit